MRAGVRAAATHTDTFICDVLIHRRRRRPPNDRPLARTTIFFHNCSARVSICLYYMCKRRFILLFIFCALCPYKCRLAAFYRMLAASYSTLPRWIHFHADMHMYIEKHLSECEIHSIVCTAAASERTHTLTKLHQ
jgi:hypothetical protein